MHPSHAGRKENIQLNIEEISEDELPQPGLPVPVVGVEEFIKVRKWQVNRVFVFLTAIAGTCLSAVVASQSLVVLGAVIAIWVGAVLLAKFLLTGTYRRHRQGPARSR